MKRFIQIIRYLFAVFFVLSGLGYFMGFMPLPQMTGTAQQLVDAMVNSGFLMNLVKITEILAGLLLLCDLIAPLALVIMAPVLLNILIFNLVLNPSAIAFSIVLFIIYLGLVINYRARFMTLISRENNN